ncbi:DUF3888 domain-containing protein [Bacillus cereus]|uniref:DUF3888 domain-containing protein n=1 Tax=Bacillus cereus 03BB108 TaxID=451709 RepID=A0AAN0SRB2_BACCE|nr:DUF3888 domain-containing protein [Bacillus cereus]AJI08995.1 hypothetical protein AK40_5526 [Bacillus cereus 03BB108]EDX60020.1 hypothetical protein BC03BB108_B0172 [Bacillus cereus 03BB108]QKG99018.1 DUF3888 domain-containing protein [Bacillus cereus]
MNLKRVYLLLLVFYLTFGSIDFTYAQYPQPEEDTVELKFQDMFLVFFNDILEKDVNKYYSKYTDKRVSIYPYQVSFLKVSRINGFRGYDFIVEVEVTPVIGPHNIVGIERLKYQISFNLEKKAKLIEYRHLKMFPSNLLL